jgi:nucleoside phosphorylase
MRILVVAALAEEVVHVRARTGLDVLVTGVGKAVGAAALGKRLADGPPADVVVNVGTAGALDSTVTGVVEIDYVTQHDLPYPAIEALVSGPVERGFVLRPGTPPRGVVAMPPGARALATGDMFVADPEQAARIAASGVHLVDMEAFAYAATCAAFAVPFRCVKAVSDAADADAGLSWLDAIDGCARALGEWLDCHISNT